MNLMCTLGKFWRTKPTIVIETVIKGKNFLAQKFYDKSF